MFIHVGHKHMSREIVRIGYLVDSNVHDGSKKRDRCAGARRRRISSLVENRDAEAGLAVRIRLDGRWATGKCRVQDDAHQLGLAASAGFLKHLEQVAARGGARNVQPLGRRLDAVAPKDLARQGSLRRG